MAPLRAKFVYLIKKTIWERDGGYWMVLGALDPATHVIDLFSAESAQPTDCWRIVTEPGDPALALRVADRPDPGGWDATGYHYPSCAAGFDRDADGRWLMHYTAGIGPDAPRSATALVAGDELVVFCTAMGRSGTGPAPLFGIGRAAAPLEGLT